MIGRNISSPPFFPFPPPSPRPPFAFPLATIQSPFPMTLAGSSSGSSSTSIIPPPSSGCCMVAEPELRRPHPKLHAIELGSGGVVGHLIGGAVLGVIWGAGALGVWGYIGGEEPAWLGGRLTSAALLLASSISSILCLCSSSSSILCLSSSRSLRDSSSSSASSGVALPFALDFALAGRLFGWALASASLASVTLCLRASSLPPASLPPLLSSAVFPHLVRAGHGCGPSPPLGGSSPAAIWRRTPGI